MDVAETMAERHARTLARFAELSLSLAEDVHADALAAPEVDAKVRLAGAFQRVARLGHQSVALEARLERDRTHDAREAERHHAALAADVSETRKRQVRADVERRIVCEIDPRESPAWIADLEERLDEEALYQGFTDEPVEAHIARLAEQLGLTGEHRHDYVPRACRPRGGPPVALSRDYRAFYESLLARGEDEDGEEQDEDQDDEDEDAEDRDDEDGEADDAPPADGEAPPERPDPPPPPPQQAAPEPDPPPPESLLPDPRPPDRPPDPPIEPYIPPWERLRPAPASPAAPATDRRAPRLGPALPQNRLAPRPQDRGQRSARTRRPT